MAGNIVLRSYLDLVNGPLENTVNYSNDRNPIPQTYTSMRKFTKRVGALALPIEKTAIEGNGFVFQLHLLNSAGGSGATGSAAKDILDNIQNKMTALANGISVTETSANSLVYHQATDWSKYVLDFGNDLTNPRYLAFFNLDSQPIYICKACSVGPQGDYTLVPFLKINPNQSIGPIIFNPRFGLLFVVSDNTDEEQDLYVIAYNA